jgi:hypothetical protein
LLAEHADVVAKFEESFEQVAGLVGVSGGVQCVGEPEGAGEKGAFGAGQAVDVVVVLRLVAQQEPVGAQLLLDGVDGAGNPGVVVGQKPRLGG